MSNKVKEILEKRIEFLDNDISWYERALKDQQCYLAETVQKLDGQRTERDEIQSYIEANFPKDVVLEQLQKTREVLAERGRTRQTLINRNTCEVCLLGAVGIAVLGEAFEQAPTHLPFRAGQPETLQELKHRRGEASEVANALAAELGLAYEATYPDLYRFNDREITTDEDVFDLIDRAIETRKAAA